MGVIGGWFKEHRMYCIECCCCLISITFVASAAAAAVLLPPLPAQMLPALAARWYPLRPATSSTDSFLTCMQPQACPSPRRPWASKLWCSWWGPCQTLQASCSAQTGITGCSRQKLPLLRRRRQEWQAVCGSLPVLGASQVSLWPAPLHSIRL
jgi:hypothetical protein